MPNYLGSKTGLTGIPSLLISNLSSIKDAGTQKALYQIQNWANSFLPVVPISATYSGTLTTSSATYVNLTNQPIVKTQTGTTALVLLTANIGITSASGGAQMSLAITGASTVSAPAGSNVLSFIGTFANDASQMTCATYITGLTSGISSFITQFRATSGGTAFFGQPTISVFPNAI